MIKLGLARQDFKRQHELSPPVLQALLETAAWCSRGSSQRDELRSPELDPSAFLKIPPFNELGLERWSGLKRESYKRAIAEINQTRSALLREENTAIGDLETVQSKGKLLFYQPWETVTDGAAAASSRGFFDVEDAPPWDTWFLYSGGTIFSWVPESSIQNAQDGIDANPVDCIHWSDWSKLPSANRNLLRTTVSRSLS